MRRKKIFFVGLFFLFLINVVNGETKVIVNDYSEDPQLVIIQDKSEKENYHGNIAGAFYKIDSTEYDSVIQEFDIYFERISPYGSVTVGLSSGEDTGTMQISFCRGDTEILERYHSQIKGARGHFLFENSDGIVIKEVPEVSFEQGKEYHIKMKYKKGEYVQIEISGKDEEGVFKLWDSGELKVIGKANFNRVYFGVNSFTGSDIHYDKNAKHIFLKGVSRSGGSSPSPYVMIAFVDNMVIKYGE